MTVVRIRTRYYEGLSTDDKPTGVINGTTFRETDTRANWITYDGDNWEVADKRVRIVNEDGSFVDLPAEFDALVIALEAGFDVAALEATLAVVDALVDAIKVKTDGLGILTQSNVTITTDGNEQTIYINNAPSGIYDPIAIKINTTNHTATETITIKEYYRISSGGDWLDHCSCRYIGTTESDEITISLSPNRYGVKITIKKNAGTNRDYICEAIYKVVP